MKFVVFLVLKSTDKKYWFNLGTIYYKSLVIDKINCKRKDNNYFLLSIQLWEYIEIGLFSVLFSAVDNHVIMSVFDHYTVYKIWYASRLL